MEVIIIVSLIISAYLLGSIPSAVWIGKRFYGVDVREHGSKNAGATNVLRVLGRRAAIPVFTIDALKGYAAVMLSFLSPLTPYGEPFFNLRIALIVAAVAGHIFPIFAGFRGGKGVATISGCLIAMSPIPLLCSFAAFAIVFLVTHYVSLGSIVAALLFPLFTFIKFYLFEREVSPTMMIFSVIVAAVLIFMHRKNFRRLKEGTESKTYLFKKEVIRGKKIVANIKRNTPKLLLITVVLFALAIYRNSLFGDVLRKDNTAALENLQEVADKFYGEKVTLRQRDNVLFEVDNGGGAKIGTVAWSYQFAQGSKGYAGATPIAIFMDSDELVRGVALLRNNETKRFVSRVAESGFFESWNGQKMSDIKEHPQAISGATLTTNSVIANFRQTQAYVANSEDKAPLDLQNLLGQLAIVAVLILSLVVCFLPSRTRWLRIPVLLLSVGVLGVWQGAFVSVELIYKWFVYGTSFAERFGLIIVVVTAFVVPFIFGRAQYCTYLCPFGAAQELVGKLNKKKVAIPPLVLRIFRYFRWAALVVLTVVVALNPFFELSEVEPFTIFLINSAATSVVVIAAVSIVASLFFQRPWCRLLCPTGELLRN